MIEFCPGVAIFADAAACRVYEQLIASGLLNFTEQVVRSAIGWIVPADLDRTSYHYQLLSDPASMHSDSRIEAVRVMRDRVDTAEAKKKDRDYIVKQTIPHWYVVGHLHSHDTRRVVEEIREQGFDQDEISCLFICDQREEPSRDQPSHNPDVSAPPDTEMTRLSQWANQQKVSFCYFYGDVSQAYRHDYRQATIDYVVAQALFFLLNAGVVIQEQIKMLPHNQQPQFYHGTLSTSMIYAPRAAIQTACVAEVTALLLGKWLDDIDKTPEMNKVSLEGVEDEAKQYGSILRQWIMFDDITQDLPQDQPMSKGGMPWSRSKNGQTPPGAHEFSPSKQHLTRSVYPQQSEYNEPGQEYQQYQQQHEELSKQTTELFRLLTLDRHIPRGEVVDHIRQHMLPVKKNRVSRSVPLEGDDRAGEQREDKEIWPGKIADAHAQWELSLVNVWQTLRQKAYDNLKSHIQDIRDRKGPEWTFAYCNQLSEEIAAISQDIERRREKLLKRVSDAAAESEAGVQEKATGDTQKRAERALEEADAHVHSVPEGNTSLITGALTISLFSVTLWILISIFTGEQIWLLVVLLACGLLIMSIARRVYTQGHYHTRLQQNQEAALSDLQRRKLLECQQLSLARRRELLVALNECLATEIAKQSMTSNRLRDSIAEFHHQATTAIEEVFQAEPGKRDFLGGNQHYFKNKDDATRELLLLQEDVTYPLSNEHKSRSSGRIFSNLTSNREDPLLEYIKFTLLTTSQANTPTSYYKQEIANAVEQRLPEFLSSTDFTVHFDEQDLWERIPSRLKYPLLWQPQQHMQHSTLVFILANRGDMNKAQGLLEKAIGTEVVDITMPYSGGYNIPGYTSHWLLVAALYYRNSLEEGD